MRIIQNYTVFITHSMLRIIFLLHLQEDLLIHGDSMYDMIDKQDHQAVQNELVKSVPTHGDDERLFLCRMNVSRNARRQMRFGDQKVRFPLFQNNAYVFSLFNQANALLVILKIILFIRTF